MHRIQLILQSRWQPLAIHQAVTHRTPRSVNGSLTSQSRAWPRGDFPAPPKNGYSPGLKWQVSWCTMGISCFCFPSLSLSLSLPPSFSLCCLMLSLCNITHIHTHTCIYNIYIYTYFVLSIYNTVYIYRERECVCVRVSEGILAKQSTKLCLDGSTTPHKNTMGFQSAV